MVDERPEHIRLNHALSRLLRDPDVVPTSSDPGIRFLVRALRPLGGLYTDFRMIEIADYADVLEHVSPDSREVFVSACADLREHLTNALRAALALRHGEEGVTPEHVMRSLLKIRAAALEIVSALDVPPWELDQPRRRFGRPADATMLHQHYATLHVWIATEAINAYAALARFLTSEEGEAASEKGNAIRRRRYRNRKRRRVAAVVPVEVYDDDLALLHSFGFLTQEEKSDPAAISSALQALLLQAFLTYPDPMGAQPWRERVARQKGRIRALSERDNEQDPQ